MLNGSMTLSISRRPALVYTSVLKSPLGAHFLTGLDKEGVISMSRWHLKCLQEGTLQNYSKVVNSGVVGGKL